VRPLLTSLPPPLNIDDAFDSLLNEEREAGHQERVIKYQVQLARHLKASRRLKR
jgi:hypothetical protein